MKPLAVVGLVAAVLMPLWLFDPSASRIFPPCIFRALTGWQCPGCGSARALHALLHGHVETALRTNLFAVMALPLVCVEGIRRAAGAEMLTARLGGRPVLLLAAALVLFALARNL